MSQLASSHGVPSAVVTSNRARSAAAHPAAFPIAMSLMTRDGTCSHSGSPIPRRRRGGMSGGTSACARRLCGRAAGAPASERVACTGRDVASTLTNHRSGSSPMTVRQPACSASHSAAPDGLAHSGAQQRLARTYGAASHIRRGLAWCSYRGPGQHRVVDRVPAHQLLHVGAEPVRPLPMKCPITVGQKCSFRRRPNASSARRRASTASVGSRTDRRRCVRVRRSRRVFEADVPIGSDRCFCGPRAVTPTV